MKASTAILMLSAALACAAEEKKEDLATKIAEHQDGARKLAEKQDELAGDVQQLIIEQTQPTVMVLLKEVSDAMDEASQKLTDGDRTDIRLTFVKSNKVSSVEKGGGIF